METGTELFNKYLLIKQCGWSKGTMVKILGYDIRDVTEAKSYGTF